jgi:alanyl-tRNA synthetase
MTERLYYTEPSKREFDAAVIEVIERDGRTLVRLDRSAFYPTSGGQPFDTGALGGATVLDVFDETGEPAGDVLHAVERPEFRAGDRVAGTIDWLRRFDHMQQHTGQHILSAAFDRGTSVATVSFHMGAEVSTIDLGRDVGLSEIDAAEHDANRVVWENRPVRIRFATEAEAAQLPLRKAPKKSGTLRLIDVEEWDLSACGGTHVARTGEIGIIAVSGWERFKGGTRVEFVCGGRALTRFRSLRDTTAAAVRALSVSSDDIPQAIERMQTEAKDHRRALAALETQLAGYKAVEMVAAAETTSVGRVVAKAVDTDAAGLKALAAAMTANTGVAVILVSTSSPALVVVARATDVSVKASEVVAALTAKFGGRGGGKPDLAQAGGLTGTAAEILDEARKNLKI